MIKTTKLAGFFLGLGLLFSAFSLGFRTDNQIAKAQAANALVRVANMSPDAPTLDIYLDGNKALTSLPFKSVSDYLSLPGGEHRFEMRPTGASASDKALIDVKTTVEAGKAYTVTAINEASKIAPLVLVDDITAPAADKAKVRLIHASPDAPPLDLARKGGPALVNNLASGKASDTFTLDAATYDLEVRPTGTTTAALSLPGTKLEAGQIYTVFAAGKQADLSLVAVAYSPSGSAAPVSAPAAGFGGNQPYSFNLNLIAVLVLALGALFAAVLLRYVSNLARK